MLVTNPLGPWNKGSWGSVINVKKQSSPAPFSLWGHMVLCTHWHPEPPTTRVGQCSRPQGAILEHHVPVGWVSGFRHNGVHSPRGVLGVCLQGHILAFLVDVDPHGVCGELSGVCAHLRVLQGLSCHAALAALASCTVRAWVTSAYPALPSFNPLCGLQQPTAPALSMQKRVPCYGTDLPTPVGPEGPAHTTQPLFCSVMLTWWHMPGIPAFWS